MEEFNALLQTQQQVVTGLETLLTNFKKDSKERKTPDYIKRKLETLDLYWREFQATHEKLCLYEVQDCDYFTGNHYEMAKQLYSETRDKIQKAATQYIQPASPFVLPSNPKAPSPVPSTSFNPTLKVVTTPKPEFKQQGNNSMLDEMMRKQSSNFKALGRTLANINLSNISEKWEFEDILKSLESRWSAIDNLHWELDSILNGENEEYESRFTRYENSYSNAKKQINSMLWSAAHREKMTPHLDIPEFHGSYQQWTSFKDLFSEAIHGNPCLSNAQKMQFLKSKIKGEPERLIQHLPITTDNYITCWEILNHRYNNKKLIFSTHMNTIMSLPILQQATSNQVKRIHDVTTECLNGIKNLGVDIETWDPMLVHILSLKLDPETHNEYMASLKQPRELPSLKDFLEFLESKFTTMESSRRKQESVQTKNNNYFTTTLNNQHKLQPFKSHNKPSSSRFQQGNRTLCCPVCQNEHGIYFCEKFREMDPSSQRSTIARLHFCPNCLYNHNGKQCQSTRRCKSCSGYHNTLLHEAYTNKNTNTRSNHVTHITQQCTSPPEILLATALINVQAADGVYHTLRALIDQGSQVSLITERAAQQLKLQREKYTATITGIGSNNSICKGATNITCSALSGGYSFNAQVFIMTNLTRNLPNSTLIKPSWEFLDEIELADPYFYQSTPIDILLGAEVYANIILERIERADCTTPIAQETKLGWILCGKVPSLQCNVTLINLEDIQKFWEIEDISENPSYSNEDEECIKFYKSTTSRLEDGKYQVRLPLKSNIDRDLGQSKGKAIAQFQHLERKFAKQENIAVQYRAFIHEYLSLGHMKRSRDNNSRECYLPHHCVTRDDSTTTSLRVVFNASAKTSNGTSLNDFMYKGPNLQNDLMALIIQWRQHRIAFIADIEKMFRQLWVHPDDQGLQKIVWRDAPRQLLREYQLTTVTYGTKAAPFLAMMTLKQLASDEKHKYPEAAHVVENCFYMDDLLYGTETITSAKQMQDDLIQLLRTGGFNLRKWRSNHVLLRDNTNKGDKQDTDYNFKQAESTKTLGLNWDPANDVFSFNITIDPDDAHRSYTTKRKLLSEISTLFDPLGWLTPLSTLLKLIFQDIWKDKLQWDDKIPEKINTTWIKIKQELKLINSFKIPRWYGTGSTSTEVEVHGFCDASQKAYACVIYCKTITNGNTKIVLIAGKSRLVPLNKTTSLPRLELSGAVLLTKLMEKVKQSLNNHNIKMYGWVDSTAVLGWIQGEPERWKVFVANRVRQITQVMPSSCWRYVKSADNPADCASRGLTPSQLKEQSLWWQGPTWLSEFKAEDNMTHNYQTEVDVKKPKQVNIVQYSESNAVVDELLNKYSSLSKVIHVLAWIRRFITRTQQRDDNEAYLTVTELKQATTIIVKHVQATEFRQEILDLNAGSQISKRSKILNLNPFLDEFGILRVGGRLKHANIDPEMKHPAILPHNHRLTQLIIMHAHEATYHGGARVTQSFIRRKYWVIGGNNATKKLVRRCVVCKKQSPAKHRQLMGDLPPARVTPSRPFRHTRVDYTGHVYIKASKGRGIKTTKAYVAVFVCMVTKAVHLELVADMTTSSFIAAIRRMAARRGAPEHMYSDNGRNFVGANRVLQEEFQEIVQVMGDEFKAEIADMHITWHYNAPTWASAGGLWEAAVKSFKFHLKRVIGEQKLTFEEFTTLLTQIEGVLNSRPLCPLTEDPDDLNYLTPAHFLSGGPTLNLIETEKDQRTRWYLTQKITQDLWKRWRSEYLIQLAARSKWRQPQRNLELDDVVLIHDDNLPPGKWTMGRVTELHQGKDGYVRVVSLKTKNGVLKRPVVKVSRLLEMTIKMKTSVKQVTYYQKLTTTNQTRTPPARYSSVWRLLSCYYSRFYQRLMPTTSTSPNSERINIYTLTRLPT